MSRRTVVIALHWSVLFMVLAMIKGGTAAEGLRWAFVIAGLGWIGVLLTGGLLGRPGPKLSGLFRAAYPWMHYGMYALLVLAVLANAADLIGLGSADAAWNSLLVLFVASIFHSIFHLWRHTTLNDGALRMMTPKIWHKYL
ncbi:hypothetical protein SAMN04488515_1841 [Cognatiyoonia koreensis]|uniref:Cytochrome b561 n=1 Tax=Cognatiyoonia koreensis TaxID=364200 RepID=A0A1I0QDZ3_9RHOB|nr:hypothetical protein [Cognatiyoonia koreensis]SEW25106.1 hypothetical protein SAMN04488515_1841 [Cognatiyoonia koreensis]